MTGTACKVTSVAETLHPTTSMGGLRVVPDTGISQVNPASFDLLILPGAELWDEGGGVAFTDLAARFLSAGKRVAAICGATYGLARDGLLDERRHTSAALDYLSTSGYKGQAFYEESRAVIDDERLLITAGPDSPVQFATATLLALGLITPETRDAYERVFHRADPTAYPALLEAVSTSLN